MEKQNRAQDYEEAKLQYNEEKAVLNEWELANGEFKPWDPTYLRLNWSLHWAEVMWKHAKREAAVVDETKDSGSQDAIVEEQKAKWRYDKVHKGLTEWEQDHPGFKAWNVQHIQLQMLLSDVEDRWKKAQENARLVDSRLATTRNTVKNAMRLRNHVSAALREWKSEHPNCDILDPERQQLLELRREADKRLMAAREVADVLKSSGTFCRMRCRLIDCRLEEKTQEV
ncbi:hypothetical protein AeNC1_016326 [Aphanomyces euteiches]|nr:hypothetical protein AeNC1_016326 [Aphanomyces euteiches]